jgi:outer membrane lipoprotein-sorting protein
MSVRLAASIACVVCVVAAFAIPVAAVEVKSGDVMGQYAAAWGKLTTYTCTITSREISGSKVQDRVYAMFFQKPHDTRLNITGGDGKGSAAVWNGGDTVAGHQGGWLSMIKLNLNIHAHLATTIRGTTIADANWGAIFDHLTGLKSTTATADTDGTNTTISVPVPDPASDGGVTKEVVILGKDSLPVEYDQYEGDQQVKHVVYSDVKLNVTIPPSTWSI